MAKGGRPRHQPTDENRAAVLKAVADGTTRKKISRDLGISEPTLREYYPAELETGDDELENKLCGQLFKMALDPTCKSQLGAIAFALKTKFGYKETQKQEIDAKLDLPQPIQVIIESTKKP